MNGPDRQALAGPGLRAMATDDLDAVLALEVSPMKARQLGMIAAPVRPARRRRTAIWSMLVAKAQARVNSPHRVAPSATMRTLP